MQFCGESVGVCGDICLWPEMHTNRCWCTFLECPVSGQHTSLLQMRVLQLLAAVQSACNNYLLPFSAPFTSFDAPQRARGSSKIRWPKAIVDDARSQGEQVQSATVWWDQGRLALSEPFLIGFMAGHKSSWKSNKGTVKRSVTFLANSHIRLLSVQCSRFRCHANPVKIYSIRLRSIVFSASSTKSPNKPSLRNFANTIIIHRNLDAEN